MILSNIYFTKLLPINKEKTVVRMLSRGVCETLYFMVITRNSLLEILLGNKLRYENGSKTWEYTADMYTEMEKVSEKERRGPQWHTHSTTQFKISSFKGERGPRWWRGRRAVGPGVSACLPRPVRLPPPPPTCLALPSSPATYLTLPTHLPTYLPCPNFSPAGVRLPPRASQCWPR